MRVGSCVDMGFLGLVAGCDAVLVLCFVGFGEDLVDGLRWAVGERAGV